MKRFIRTAAALLALVMLAASVPSAALAAGAKEVIERVEITGYVAPEVGKKPITAAELSVPEGAHYEVTQLYFGRSYSISAEPDEEFSAGCSYDANFELVTTDRNHVFGRETVITVNGEEIENPTDEECPELALEINYPLLGEPVTSAGFSGYVKPEKGMCAKADIVCSNSDVKAVYSYWRQSGNFDEPKLLTENDVFDYGIYDLFIAVELNPEKPLYLESSSFSGTLNGEEAESYISETEDGKYTAVVFNDIIVGEPVGKYEITGFEVPEPGKPCTSAVSLSGSEHCKASGAWLDVDTGRRLGSSEVFEKNRGYIFELTLTCDEGYVLDTLPKIFLGGYYPNILDSGIRKDKNSYVFRSRGLDDRKVTGDANIYGVAVPRVGEVNSTRAYTLPEQHCHISDIFWYCRTDGRKTQPGEKFEAGKCYYLSVDITADDGYAFDWIYTTAMINGGRIGITEGLAEGKYCRFTSFDFDFSEPEDVTRLAGDDRTGTAVEISKAGFPDGAESVVIASGDGFADALAGVPLAYAMDAPILLVRGNSADAGTLAEIKRLGAEDIVILGGAGAVSANAEKELSALGKVTRIAGADRFETSALIAERLFELKGAPREALFACSNNYPDALAAGSPAALEGAPILYMAQNGVLSAPVKNYLEKHGIFRAVILGGESAISETAEKSLTDAGIYAPERIYGADRYDTCASIAERYETLFSRDRLCAATGMNYPDALAGGVFAAKRKAPMMLTGDCLSYDQQYDAEYKEDIYIFGGTGAVSDAVANQLARCRNGVEYNG